MRDKRGFILLLTFIMMVVLTMVSSTVLFMMTYETRDVGVQIDDAKLLNLADAGAQLGLRAIRDDALTTTQTGTADLRANTTSGTASTSSRRNRVRYYNEGSVLSMTADGDGTTVIISNFDDNYLNAAITNVSIGCRFTKASSGGTSPRLEILYTTNGVFPQAGNSSFDASVSSTSYNAAPFVVLNITGDRAWTWADINNANFQIRARAYNSKDRSVDIDYFFLQVTYAIDTSTEAWSTGSYASFPISLGSGSIASTSITAEQGKVHLNTASQVLLRYLLEERGVASATANTLATNIITYRSTKPFDSVEELQQVSGMTAAVYALVKDYVTVYSYINTSVARASGSRAPININTAPREVLEAIFDPLGLGASDPASLATDIIAFRAVTPFTCFYNNNSATDFYDFVIARAYLSASEENIILDNADASSLIPVAGYAGSNAVTTEFCYDTNAFMVESVADNNSRNLRLKTAFSKDGSGNFSTYAGDPTLTGYRKESFE